jgi:hypothetical protein
VRIEDDEGKKGIYADDEKGIEIIVSKRVTWVKDDYDEFTFWKVSLNGVTLEEDHD